MSARTKQLRRYIVDPTLRWIGLYSESASNLVIMTIIAESDTLYIHQFNEGPAIGLCQMEKATHDDCWDNYLKYKPELAEKIKRLEIPGLWGTGVGSAEEMAGNAYYAVAMCRIKYLRDRHSLPASDDIEGLAQYHKRVYNTHLGAAVPSHTANLYRRKA